jgi:hypothetical protein
VMDWQAVLPVERQEIIVVSKFKKKHTIDPVAIDPTTGQPFFVIFVNNTNPNLGDGTFENPFANLTNLDNVISAENAAMDGNTIYVFTGDGSSTGMQGGSMQLQFGNRLLGSANSHQFQTTKGLLTVPAFTTVKPNVQGQSTGGNANHIIRLASNCEVSGLNINYPTFSAAGHGWACITALISVTNTNVNNNNLVNENFGVQIPIASANFTFGPQSVTNNTVSGHGAGIGISFPNAINGIITIANNVVRDNPNSPGIVCSMNGGTIYNITDNVVEDSLQGISCNEVNVGNFPQRAHLIGNTVNNTTGSSFSLATENDLGQQFTCIVEDNVFINEGAQSVIQTDAADSNICVRFNNNTGYPSQFAGNPYLIDGAAGGTIQLETPLNNFPQPATMNNVSNEPACFCGPPCD